MVRTGRSSPLPPQPGAARLAAGFSLVEMMVAIVVSLILMAGVIQLFVANKQAYRIQEGASRLNDNARFAMYTLRYDLRMADHWGGVDASQVVVGTTPSMPSDCPVNATGIRGYDGGSTSPIPNCIPNSDYEPNTDVIIVRYAGAGDVAVATATGGGSGSEYVVAALGRRAQITKGSAFGSLPSDIVPTAAGTFIYPYAQSVYYVNQDGVLVHRTLSGSTLSSPGDEVVDGVASMQAEYGIDTDGDRNADIYENASAVASDDWAKVVTVRVSLLLRNPEVDVNAKQAGHTYAMAGGYTYTVPANQGQYAHKLYTYVFQARNQNRR